MDKGYFKSDQGTDKDKKLGMQKKFRDGIVSSLEEKTSKIADEMLNE